LANGQDIEPLGADRAALGSAGKPSEADWGLSTRRAMRSCHLKQVLDFQRQVLACPYGGLGAIGRLDLLQNAFDVDFDGRFRETKPARDLLVGERARFVQ
jgi:hypothetical protein